MKNSFLRTLVPLLSIGLNDEGAGGGSGGGEAPPPPPDAAAGADKGGAAAGGAADKKSDPAADAAAAKTAEAAKQAETAKAAAELGKSYEKWEPALPKELPFDKARFGDLRKSFVELGIKPEVGQKLVDLFATGELGRLKSVAEGLSKEREGYQTALKADKELAGEDGKLLEQTMASARRAMQKFATPGFRELLSKSGLEAHPEMVRILSRAGALLKEDDTGRVARTGAKGPELTPEQKLKARYDHPTSQEMFRNS